MRRRAPPSLGSAIQVAALTMSSALTPQMLRRLLGRGAVCRQRLGEAAGRGVDEGLVEPALVRDVGEHRVEEREVGAGVDREVQHVLLAGRDLAGVDGHGAPRVDDDDARGGMRLVGQLLLLLGRGLPGKVRDPVVEEVVGLGLERVGADRHDGVGELGVLVAVVELAHAHVAGGVDLGVVGRAVVDADVLDLHRLEVELAGAPGVLVAAAGAAVVEGRDEEAVLALLLDHRDGHARHEVERVLPARRHLHALAPDHRVGQPLRLGRARLGEAHLGHARAAHRAEAGVHLAVRVGLDDEVHVAAVLLDDVVHRGRVPGGGLGLLLLGEIDAEDVLVGRGAALLVHRPGIGVVAAADDAELADDVVDGGVRGDDRQAVDVALESHDPLPQSTFDRRP